MQAMGEICNKGFNSSPAGGVDTSTTVINRKKSADEREEVCVGVKHLYDLTYSMCFVYLFFNNKYP